MSLCWEKNENKQKEAGFGTYISIIPKQQNNDLGQCVGQVVSVLTLYSDDPSSNPFETYSFIYKICAWNERK